MSIDDTTVSFSLEVNVEKAHEDVRKLQMLLYRTLALIRRFGLPEDLEQGIIRIQKMISTLNMLRLAFIAVETASGPVGWALAAVGIASATMSAGDFIMELGTE